MGLKSENGGEGQGIMQGKNMVYGAERWGEEQVIGYSYRYANKSQLDI